MFEKGLKESLKYTFKTLNFLHMNSSGSVHSTSDVMSDLSKVNFRFITWDRFVQVLMLKKMLYQAS